MRNSRAGKCIFCGKMWRKSDIGKGAVYMQKLNYDKMDETVVVACEKHTGVIMEKLQQSVKEVLKSEIKSLQDKGLIIELPSCIPHSIIIKEVL